MDPVLMGDQAIESSLDSNTSGSAEAFPFSDQVAGTATSITVYLDHNDRANKLIVGLYSDANGQPGLRLTTGSLSAPKAGAWNTVPVGSARVQYGTRYWVAVLGRGGALYFRDRTGGPCHPVASSQTSLMSLPSSWTGGSESSACPISAYVAGTAAAGSAPLSPPSNTALPQITGTAQQGSVLTASTGSWSNSPGSYAYQWLDCVGTGCSKIAGATGSTHTLQTSDVGSTIEVAVTATNSSGSASASSAQTSVVTAVASPPPAAVFSFSPASPVTGQSVHFDGTGTSCPDGPCTYSYVDVGPDGTASYPLGSSPTFDFTFQDAGTKYVTLTVTDSQGRTSKVEHDVTVSASQPSPLAAPVNTAPPTIGGTAQQGQTLAASSGSWNNSPTSYAYQWQDCGSGTCQNISGATSATYTLQSSSAGSTLDVVVTASNSGGSASASSAQTGVVATDPGGGGGTCNLNATTSNFSSQVAAATPGQTVCLESGDYSSFSGPSKSSPGITITSAPGATVTFNSGITLNLGNVQNFTLDGTAGGGTMSIGGELDMQTSGDALQNQALNLTFQNISFPAGSNVFIEGPENSNITFNQDSFTNTDDSSDCSGLGAEFYLPYATSGLTTPSGVTVENSTFTSPTSLQNPNRALETAAPFSVLHDTFAGYLNEPGCNHIDVLQQYGGGAGNITFEGNLCYDDYNCFAAWDGTQNNTITDNVCYNVEVSCINLYSDRNSVVEHNTVEAGGANNFGCPPGNCTSDSILNYSNKSGSATSTGAIFTNNIGGSYINNGTFATNSNNLIPGAGSPNINGSPTFTGGTNPTTWAGFELTAGSTGHDAATDGTDVGIQASACCPPSG